MKISTYRQHNSASSCVGPDNCLVIRLLKDGFIVIFVVDCDVQRREPCAASDVHGHDGKGIFPPLFSVKHL